VVLKLDEAERFREFEAALHNFSNTFALQIENLDYRHNLEERVRQRTEELELLLREIHHRIKNNLNVVESLLRIQLGNFSDARIHKALQESIDRIKSIALVHKYLYRSHTLASIDFKSFIQDFVDEISRTYSSGLHISIIPDMENVPVHIDSALPVSLIINELVTNALKYAFPDGQRGVIHIGMTRKDNDMLELTVSDNGVGLPDGFDLNRGESLGMQLVQGLTSQLKGELSVVTSPGTAFHILFKGSG
jgi:two-component sensor histidine kinase